MYFCYNKNKVNNREIRQCVESFKFSMKIAILITHALQEIDKTFSYFKYKKKTIQ